MKSKLIVITAILVSSLTQINAQEIASTILKKAYKEAKKSNKNVFVIFSASWCGYCKKLDANINSSICKSFFDKNYVIKHLVVFESEKNKYLENPGAIQMLKKYKGLNSGIPFWLIFDKNGTLLEDSLDTNKNNLGCPVTKKEVSKFIKILKNTSNLNAHQLEIIASKFYLK